MRRILILAALLMARPAAAQDVPVLTLDEAVRLASDGNRNVRIARLDVNRAERMAGTYRAQMLPALTFQLQQGQFLNPLDFTLEQGALGVYPVVGPIPGTDTIVSSVNGSNTRVNLRLAQPITQLHKLGLAAEVQDREADAAREDVRARTQQAVSQVRQGYHALLDTQNALAAAEDALAFHEEFERVVSEYLKQGTALSSDVLDVQAARARDRQAVLTLRNALQTQKEQLNLLLGRPLDTPFQVAEREPEAAPQEDPKALLMEALTHRPEVRQAAVRVAQAEAARELQRADYVPDVSMALSYDRASNTGLLPPEYWMLLFQAEYDLYDGGRRDHAIAEKDLAVQQAREALAQARDQVDLELRSQLRRLQELASQEEAGRLARKAAEEKLRVTLTRYQHRAALSRAVLQAQAELTSARRDYQKILLDQASARAELDRILGRDP